MNKLLMIGAALLVSTSAAKSNNYTMFSNAPKAGDPIKVTVNRADSKTAETVILSTKDNTALVNIDYDYSSIGLNFAPQQVSASVLIPTHTTTSKFGQTLKVGIILNLGLTQISSILVPLTEPVSAPVINWVPAPMANNGYTRCKTIGGCHGFAAGYPAIIAPQGAVMMYAWNGIDAFGRVIGVFWPQDHDPHLTKMPGDWYLGLEGWSDEWEGVSKQ